VKINVLHIQTISAFSPRVLVPNYLKKKKLVCSMICIQFPELQKPPDFLAFSKSMI
jgi:hypothetical protein